MAIKQLKTLKMEFDGKTVECQLTRAALVDNPDTEDLTTFCGVETSSTPRYTLEIGGIQDWGLTAAGSAGPPVVSAYDAVCDILHDSYRSYQNDAIADAPIDCLLTVGLNTRQFDAKPQGDVPFGGDAGAALTFDSVLDVLGDVTEGSVTP